jgi:hypothetical protein
MAGVQGFNGVQAGIADLKYVAATENCHDRQVISDGLRDVIAAQTANTNMLNNTIIGGIQAIKDDLCQQRLANKDAQINALQNQLNMANLEASQQAQNAFIAQGFANEVDALYDRLNTCPVPSMPVYGRTPIFTCNGGCGCNG